MQQQHHNNAHTTYNNARLGRETNERSGWRVEMKGGQAIIAPVAPVWQQPLSGKTHARH